MRIKRLTAILSLAVLAAWGTASAEDAEGIAWHKTWQEALAASKTSGKCVWVNVWGPDCPYCAQLRQTTLPDKSVIAALAEFECADLNVADNADFCTKYADLTDRFPSFVFLDAEGQVVYTALGYMPPDRFTAELDRAQKAFELSRQLAQAPDDGNVLFELGHLYADRAMYGAPRASAMAQPLLKKLLASDPEDKLGHKEDALLDLAICLAVDGNLDDALAGLEAHVKAYPKAKRQADRLYFLGAVYMGREDLPQAKQAWEQLAADFPDTIPGRAAKRGLQVIDVLQHRQNPG
jgi:tetratricopeptide (TPR) repeat protein